MLFRSNNATFATAKAALLAGLNETDATAETRGTLPLSLKMVRSTTTPLTNLLLDDYPNAAAAFSIRKLDKNYTGYCMKVRRASDDAEADIGFDSNGDLDTAAIATHCGASNGFVSLWYDQANVGGTANNATQSAAGAQPQIYNGTSVITENGKPACFFSGDQLDISVSLTTVDFSLFATYRKTTTSGQAGVFGLGPDATTYDDIELNQYGSILTVFYGTASGFSSVQYTTSETNQRLVTFLTATNDVKLFENSTQRASATNITSKSTTTAIIRPRTSADINIQEIVVYNSNQSSNRTGIETDINTYFSIYT